MKRQEFSPDNEIYQILNPRSSKKHKQSKYQTDRQINSEMLTIKDKYKICTVPRGRWETNYIQNNNDKKLGSSKDNGVEFPGDLAIKG